MAFFANFSPFITFEFSNCLELWLQNEKNGKIERLC